MEEMIDDDCEWFDALEEQTKIDVLFRYIENQSERIKGLETIIKDLKG